MRTKLSNASQTGIGNYYVIAASEKPGTGVVFIAKDRDNFEMTKIYHGWKGSYVRKILSGRMPGKITVADAIAGAAKQLALKPENITAYSLDGTLKESHMRQGKSFAEYLLTEREVIWVTGKEPEIARIVHAAYPDYRGTKVKVVVDDHIHINTDWEGGTHSDWVFVNMATMRAAEVHARGGDVTIPDGICAVEWARFQGHDTGITIHVPRSNMAKALPVSTGSALTRDEEIVLIATRSLKSSYMGISDYRYVEANRQTGITKQAWDTAKAALIQKRMLNAAGAITISGKNAIGSKQFYQLKNA